MKTGFFRRTMIRNIAIVFAVSGKKKMGLLSCSDPHNIRIQNVWSVMKLP